MPPDREALSDQSAVARIQSLQHAEAERDRLRAEITWLRNKMGDVRGMQSDGATAEEMDAALGRALSSDDKLAACPDCDGTGHGDALGDGSGYIPCGTCAGTGQIDAEDARRYRANRAALSSPRQGLTKEDE